MASLTVIILLGLAPVVYHVDAYPATASFLYYVYSGDFSSCHNLRSYTQGTLVNAAGPNSPPNYTVSESVGSDGAISISYSEPSGDYEDAGFLYFIGTLGSISAITISSTNPVGVNLWFDSNGDGEFLSWTGNCNTGIGPDAKGLGNGLNSITTSTSFFVEETNQTNCGNNYDFTLAQLQGGACSNINSNTEVALWMGIGSFSSGHPASGSTTVKSINGISPIPQSSGVPEFPLGLLALAGIGFPILVLLRARFASRAPFHAQ
ncbi:MAG: hypothetical protein ACREBS_10975 [Nitrososphaerales archaeon]